MSAADDPKRMDRPELVDVILPNGERRSMPFRRAAGLVSLQRATFAEETPEPTEAEQETDPAPEPEPVQEIAETEPAEKPAPKKRAAKKTTAKKAASK